jgi:anti-sigma factor RsiW
MRAPSRELNGQDLAGIAATDQALSAMVGNPIQVPDLGRAGFKLVSAEIYGREQTDSIQLRYEDDPHRLFTVFLYPPGAGAFELTERGTLRICVWRNADVTAVMTGEMSTPELLHVASLTYSSLNL